MSDEELFDEFVVIEDIPFIKGEGEIAKRQLKERPVFKARQEAEDLIKNENIRFGIVIPVKKRNRHDNS